MKKKLIVGLVVLLWFSLYSFSGSVYSKGNIFITPQIALYSYAPNFGASLEYALSENIGIGATVMAAFWNEIYPGLAEISEKLITPAFDAYYHFTKLSVQKLDLFGGVSIGFSIYSWSWDVVGDEWTNAGTSGIYISPFIGARYYIAKKTAICLRLQASALGDWAGFGGVLGITIRVK